MFLLLIVFYRALGATIAEKGTDHILNEQI